MANMILCSTGTIVGKANGFDHRLIIRYRDEIDADGFELMMLKAFYGRLSDIANDLNRADVPIRTIHFEKDITALLGLGSDEDRREGLRLFTSNIEMGNAVGAQKAVFHLWDGRFSAEQVKSSISLLDTLYEICKRKNIELVVETVPCKTSPFAIVSEIAETYPDARFTFDTRHVDFCKETTAFFSSALWNRIGHLHISDYSGETVPGMWGVTRPILHPGEGIIRFDKLFDDMPAYLGETVTLESPVMFPDGSHDIRKLNQTLDYLRQKTKNL
jgi:sugar phosphate isomerase/epimerase